MSNFWLIAFIVAIALTFDFVNGFHDAANSLATVVATRVLTPAKAVALAAFFNFVAAFFLGTGVAATIGRGFVNTQIITPHVILAGLVGAIAWNLTTWYLKLPVSSSHALIGGYAGAAIAKAAYHSGLHRSGADYRTHPWLHSDDCRVLEFPGVLSRADGSLVPAPPNPVGFAAQLRARH
jgi:PiT family inorganic phosphate transporter